MDQKSHSLSETMPLILYRLAFNAASKLIERDDLQRSPKGRAAEVLAEVARVLGSEDPSIKEGVEDALSGLDPRW